jgi:ribosomal subunit interface protein
MQTSLRITFRHMPTSAALEARIREQVAGLERLHDHITGCEVMIGAPTGHHVNGAPFDVRINLQLPDGSLHVHNDGRANAEHADVYLAVRDTFDSLERMLRRHTESRQRGRDHESIRRTPGEQP